MKLYELKPVLHSTRGYIQSAIVYDQATDIDIEDGCSIEYAVEHYRNSEVLSIFAEENKVLLILKEAVKES